MARSEHGLFAVPREEILENSVHAYDGLTEDFPFLAFDDHGNHAPDGISDSKEHRQGFHHLHDGEGDQIAKPSQPPPGICGR